MMSPKDFRRFKERQLLAFKLQSGGASASREYSVSPGIKRYLAAFGELERTIRSKRGSEKAVVTALRAFNEAASAVTPRELRENGELVEIILRRAIRDLHIGKRGVGFVSLFQKSEPASRWNLRLQRVHTAAVRQRTALIEKMGKVGLVVQSLETSATRFFAACHGGGGGDDTILPTTFAQFNTCFSKTVLNFASGDIIINVGPSAHVVVNQRSSSYFEKMEKPKRRRHKDGDNEEDEGAKRPSVRQLKATNLAHHQAFCAEIVEALETWRTKQRTSLMGGGRISEPSVPELLPYIKGGESCDKAFENKVRRHIAAALGYKLDKIKEVTRHGGIRDPQPTTAEERKLRNKFVNYKDAQICLYWAALSTQNKWFVEAERPKIRRLAEKINPKITSYRHVVEIVAEWWNEKGPPDEARRLFDQMS